MTSLEFRREVKRPDPFREEYRRVRDTIVGGSPRHIKAMEELAAKGSTFASMYIADSLRVGSTYGTDLQAALHWYRYAVDLGFPHGWLGIGLVHRLDGDFVRAREAFESGASQSSAPCMRLLARMYRLSEGVERNDLKAVELLKVSAKLGNIWAMRDLSQLWITGRFGIPRVILGALIWLSALMKLPTLAFRDHYDGRVL